VVSAPCGAAGNTCGAAKPSREFRVSRYPNLVICGNASFNNWMRFSLWSHPTSTLTPVMADRNFYWAHLASAAVLISQKRQEEAIVELEQTLALNPGFTTAYKLLCEANNYLGRLDRGLDYINTRSHPAVVLWGESMGSAHAATG
jgi:hypothetical protein